MYNHIMPVKLMIGKPKRPTTGLTKPIRKVGLLIDRDIDGFCQFKEPSWTNPIACTNDRRIYLDEYTKEELV